MTMMWLSFADDDGFRGVVIIEITDEDIVLAKAEIDERFPQHLDGAELPAAAIRKTHRLGINPGGQVLAFHVPDGYPLPSGCTDRLLLKPELEKLGL